MADETNNTSASPSLSATAGQLATAAGSMVTSLIAAFGSVSSWPKVVALAIAALFALVYFDKIHTPKLDNADVLSGINEIRADISGLKASINANVSARAGEIGSQLDRMEMRNFPEPATPPAPKKSYKKPVAE